MLFALATRNAAYLEPAHAAVAMAVGKDEVPERPARQEIVDMGLPERPVGGVRGDVEPALADLAVGARRRRPRQDGSRNRRSADPRPSPRTNRTRSRRNLRADVRTAPGAPS